MSDRSQARKVQHEAGVAYNTALHYVRSPEVRAEATRMKAADTKRPFAECIVEVALRMLNARQKVTAVRGCPRHGFHKGDPEAPGVVCNGAGPNCPGSDHVEG